MKKICQIFPSLAVLTQMRDFHGCRKRKLIPLEAERKLKHRQEHKNVAERFQRVETPA